MSDEETGNDNFPDFKGKPDVEEDGFTTSENNMESDILSISQHPFAFFTIHQFKRKYGEKVALIQNENLSGSELLKFLEDSFSIKTLLLNRGKTSLMTYSASFPSIVFE